MNKVSLTNGNKSRTFLYESGSALIYVIIAVALFGALTLTLSRQSQTGEVGTMRAEDVELAASRILTTAAQVESAVKQMTFSGSTIADLDFSLPGQAGFNAGSSVHKVFHPAGGGLSLPQLDDKAKAQISTDPPSAWYLGRFNNVEWTDSIGTDVVLVAHQISQSVCANLNEKLTGSAAIPALSGATLRDILISDSFHGGSNADFDSANCGACNNQPAMCVSDTGVTAYSFYSIILGR